MTDAVGIVGATQQSAVATRAVTAAAPVIAQQNESAVSAKINQNTTISPRIVVDPLAGVITEFLSDNGQVQQQIPSAAAVAYLRIGLTADGQAKPGSVPEPKHGKTTVA